MKGRVDYMDYAKGFGMVCIILGHNAIPLGLNNWLHSFHVPLFFIVSGYFVKDCSFLHFFKSSFDGLLKPLVVTHLLSFLVLGVIFYLSSGENPYYSDWIIGQLLGIHNYGAPVLWFIYALFCGRFILLLLIKYLSKYIILISLVLFVVSSKCANILDYQSVPLYIMQGLCSVVFLSIGYKLNQYGIFLQKQLPFRLIVVSLFFLLFASKVFVSFAQMVFPLGVWNVITSSFISIIFIFLLMQIARCSNKIYSFGSIILGFIGRNSLFILCVHTLEMMLQLDKELSSIPIFVIIMIKLIIMLSLPIVAYRIPVVRSIFRVNK